MLTGKKSFCNAPNIIIVMMLSALPCPAQKKHITLISPEHFKILIFEGDRVKCRFIDGTKAVGSINNITDSTIDIDGKRYSVDDIKGITTRKKGTGLYIVTILFGGSIATAMFVPISASINQAIAIAVLPEAVIITLMIKPSQTYFLKNVKERWRLQVDANWVLTDTIK